MGRSRFGSWSRQCTSVAIIPARFRSALKQAAATFNSPNTFNYVDTKKKPKVGHEPFRCIQCEVSSLITPSRLQSYGLVPVADRSSAPPAGKTGTGVLDVGHIPT